MALLVFCLALVQPVLAATPVTGSTDFINLLRQYNVVRGDNTGDLQLGAPITRAQFATILVRITGHESEAVNLKGLGLFSDTKGHWADGEVSAARIYGLIKGFEDGTFRPEEPVTYAQAFTLVLRLVGREPDPANWPTSALLDAMELKIVPPGFTGMAALNQPAVRGEIFTSVGMALTTVKTADGQTYFQKYFDTTAPELTITSAATSTAASYQLKGTAKGASRVEVNGEAATLTGDSFTKSVTLQAGRNTLTVVAYDLVGNKATKEFVVTRGSAAATVSIDGPDKVQIGGKATYTITAYDANDNEVSADGVQVRVTGNIGTFDVATGTFTAGNTAASGKIQVTLGSATASIDVQVLGAATNAVGLEINATNVAYTKPMTVTVRVLDSTGAVVTEDFGRSVTLAATGVTGLTVTPATATTKNGVATFTVKGGAIGNIRLSATSQGLTGSSMTAAFTTTTHVALVTDQSRIPTNGTQNARIRAELRDENGNVTTNKTGRDIYVNLSIDGPGTLLNTQARIAPGASSSAQTQSDGLVAATIEVGTITVTGELADSTLKYSVDPVTISTYAPTVGTGTKFRVIPLNSRVTVGSGDAAEFMVQLIDGSGNPVSTNSYAFQVEISTSNNEAKVNGVPEGMTVQIGDNASLNPVSDGDKDGEDVIARTDVGSAVIKVFYNKPGTVTLKPVAAAATTDAYDSDGNLDDAAASSASWITSDSKGEVVFRATPNSIKLTAVSDLFGNDGPAISHKSGTTKTYTLNAYVAWYNDQLPASEQERYWVPGTLRTFDLYKNGTKVATAEARDGKATFTITASSVAGTEADYVVKDRVENGYQESNALAVTTVEKVPSAPGFASTRGVPSNMVDAVLANDDYLEFDLPQDDANQYVVVKVYNDANTLVYTSNPVDVSAPGATVRVPKDKVTSGAKRYYLKYRNGAGDSAQGAYTNTVTKFTTSTTVSVSSAKYDAVNNILYLYGSGFGKDDLVDPSKITLSDSFYKDPNPNDDDHPGIVRLDGAYPQYVSATSPYFKLDLSGMLDSELTKLATFAGSVRLSAEVGWIVKSNGQMGNEDTGNEVKPLAYISYTTYDRTTKALTIVGRGFKSGTVKKEKLKAGSHYLSEKDNSISVVSDTEIRVTLNTATKAQLDTDVSASFTAEDAWFTDGQTTPVGKMAGQENIPVYGYIKAIKVSFNTDGLITVEGTGFTGGRIGAGKVKIVDTYRSGTHEIELLPGDVVGGKVTFQVPADQLNDFLTNYKTRVYLVAEAGWFDVAIYPDPADTSKVEYRPAVAIPLTGAPKFVK